MPQHYTMPSSIQIVDYNPFYAKAFYDLNHEWISKYFEMEEADEKSLGDPQQYIINKGGHILIALFHGEPVGAVALLKEEEGIYEMSKMAVTPRAQGLRIGRLLGDRIVERAKKLGVRRIFLLSNRRLTTALSLYTRLGFVEVPMQHSNYRRADIRMELDLEKEEE